ncbi:phospholipase C, phosphocholine-specific [Caulobacter radicis]|uniref:phosphocholine-specific phospholipase C n=1 Tax=Caulobacter radicis TaxID=2172650 RepID=UPI000D56963B|nr:phospholipase C, phosphocholine-specific [Caulobacter radicis]PVM86160.1 phospholipase C, phosphocholine-specific [Caulobacter radicis]
MSDIDRRGLLLGGAAAGALPAFLASTLARAAAIDADDRTGTIADVEHVVILMQENRSFDHYFGAMAGVRGFGDRFPVPVRDAAGRKDGTAFLQAYGQQGGPDVIAPFALNSGPLGDLIRVEGTPHGWADAQDAWDEGRMDRWPVAKRPHSMGYYTKADIPFQYALAHEFTLCDAYHCSTQTGTNTNRLFLWSGTNDGAGQAGGPSISNSHDDFPDKGGAAESYRWTTYPERLLEAGVSWRIYQDMADNFTDNPLAGFAAYRAAHAGAPGSDQRLKDLALSTWHLDGLRQDVLSGRLPQVSWIIAPAADSEHPGPSSPAQGAFYLARVLDALTLNSKVWAKTALLVMFDENDGFFDHAPPPAPPSRDAAGKDLGGSTVDTTGEYHLVRNPTEAKAERDDLMGRPYGLGPRVPMYVISPWSRGGWVNSEVFDHTSVIRFLEARFGVAEPNISPWRRSVCGDLTSCFNFATPNADPPAAMQDMQTLARAARFAARKKQTTTPPTPTTVRAPFQETGMRKSRALPYRLEVYARIGDEAASLTLNNPGAAGAVLHVYDRLRLDQAPRRYTLGAGGRLEDAWPAGAYDLWLLGPNSFHRHYAGEPSDGLEWLIVPNLNGKTVAMTLYNTSSQARTVIVEPAGFLRPKPWTVTLAAGETQGREWQTGVDWYDLSARCEEVPSWRRRAAGRAESGRHSHSDPLMGELARLSR